MPKYRISLTETVQYVAEVEADSDEDALDQASVLGVDYGENFYEIHGNQVMEARFISFE
ncbi:hypothetical protein [Crossiella sp. CA198]|uniref:hypothetical protein n=1 Tax=Crossiella sp. CA198 TaxID=3455607 RepID=UPI003F8D7FC3